MKIYTKTGDSGQTALFGGARVPKHHLRVESYGTIDELNSHIGLIADIISNEEQIHLLRDIQDRLFTIGSHLATEEKKYADKLPALDSADIELLEKTIDSYTAILPEMKHFILPGGHVHASHTHIARCVCRRAERMVSLLQENTEIHPLIIPYLNRLSDFLFVLARKLLYDMQVTEIKWIPKS